MSYNKKAQLTDNHIDDHVDDEIKQCLSEKSPQSFFMFAGAGSGKTRSLVEALSYLNRERGKKLSTLGKRVAVITYTNAARDEVLRRLQNKSIFIVSTIHSFLWELIKPHQSDIKTWLEKSIKEDIEKLQEQQRKGRASKAADQRIEDIKRKNERLQKLQTIRRFLYNPNGDNVGYDSLSHSEVIKMGSEFIATEETMQEILIGKYPILLIDESQDTKKELVDALFLVCEKSKGKFTVGMFGDTMQKIYSDGKDNLSQCVPVDWAQPAKIMNHRSAKRIVVLANAIRSSIDGQPQRERSDADTGTVRLFIVSSSVDKEDTERRVAEKMAGETSDDGWRSISGYKSLILEHHMAASRFGFSGLYEPLNESGFFDTALRDGSIPELSMLATIVSPLVKAYKSRNDFKVSKIIRQHSPLLNKKAFENRPDQVGLLQKAESAVDELMSLWDDDAVPVCLNILRSIQRTGLFKLDQRVQNILNDPKGHLDDDKMAALRKALGVSFEELEKYSAYVTDGTRFATHQGVKGLEFPRVMVIMDDAEARGFLFSYEKLFGAKAKTDTDKKNESEGKDTSILRTMRLFYVACTRAQKSLAVIAYTNDAQTVRETAISNGWFLESEVCAL